MQFLYLTTLAVTALQLCTCTPLLNNTLQSVQKAFIQAGLIPDVLSSFHPTLLLNVAYTFPEPQNGESESVSEVKVVSPPGRNFTMPQTAIRPTWSIPSFDSELENEVFIVAMLDPDAPTPQNPVDSQIRHFLGANFKLQGHPTAEGLGATLVNRTPALSEYIQPSPPNTSDPHRYTWLLFRQPPDFPTNITLTPSVLNFNITLFAEQFKLGPALAGNFMTLSTDPADLAAAGES